MENDICRLCGQTASLRDSHYVPRGMYRRLRDIERTNPNPVTITRSITLSTSKQATDHVLCAKCEDRFNRGGEAYVTSMVAHGRHFPLLARLRIALVHEVLSEAVTHSGRAAGIDTPKLGYFAMSLVWRGAVHQWPTPAGGKTPLLKLGAMREPIRQYLMGEAPFPADAAVVVHVCEDTVTQNAILEPCQRINGEPSFELVTLGVHFFVFLGSTATPEVKNLCCVNSPLGIIFRRNCQNRLMAHYTDLAQTSRRSRKVQADWPD